MSLKKLNIIQEKQGLRKMSDLRNISESWKMSELQRKSQKSEDIVYQVFFKSSPFSVNCYQTSPPSLFSMCFTPTYVCLQALHPSRLSPPHCSPAASWQKLEIPGKKRGGFQRKGSKRNKLRERCILLWGRPLLAALNTAGVYIACILHLPTKPSNCRTDFEWHLKEDFLNVLNTFKNLQRKHKHNM